MIRKLHIESFGKFRNRSFDFGPVTLFVGRNEAGKTTVFDAVFDRLCSPKGTTEPGRRLKARYGGDRRAHLEFDGEEPRIPAADFLNLFAIRSGDVTLEIDSNSEWMNRVKVNLFSGGVDPVEAAGKLESDLTSRAKGSLGAEAAALEGELAGLRAGFEAARGERKVCLDGEKRVGELARKRKAAGDETAALAKEAAELEESLRRQRILREVKILRETASRPGERRKLLAELAGLRRFTREGLETLRSLDEKTGRLAVEEKKFLAAREAAADDFRRRLGEKAAAEERKNRLERIGALAEALKGGISDRERLVDRKTVVVWRLPVIAAAVLLLAAGAASFFLLPEEFAPAGLAAGAALAAAAGAFSARRETREDARRFEEALLAAAERWRRETGESWEGFGYEAVLAALNQAADRAESWGGEFLKLRDAAAAAEARVAELDRAHRAAAAEHDDAVREARKVLDASGAVHTAGYAENLGPRAKQEERLVEIEGVLAKAREEFGVSTDEELESVLARRIADMTSDAADREMSDAEIQKAEYRLREKRGRLDRLRTEEKEALGDFSLSLGAVREKFKGLPERIAELERKIALGEKRLREIGIERRAAEIARSIFVSLSTDADGMLKNLAAEIGSVFSRVVAEKRDVGLEAFALSSADVADGDGGARPEENLSAGTRDAFLLAARLTLARKSVAAGGGALVVLDEPFIALDRFRAARALDVLKEFHETAGWQIVIFTKDEVLEKQAEKVFGGLLTVIRL